MSQYPIKINTSPYTAVESTVIHKWVLFIASIKIAFKVFIMFIIGIKLLAMDMFSVSIYIEAPPIIVGINVNKLIRKDPSFTDFALRESILIIAAVKKANIPVTRKNKRICVVERPTSFLPNEVIASSFHAKEIKYPPTEINVLKQTNINTVVVLARYNGCLFI